MSSTAVRASCSPHRPPLRYALLPIAWATLGVLAGSLRAEGSDPTNHGGERLYLAACAACHGANGAGLPNLDLRRASFRHAANDEDLAHLITSGIPGTPMPAINMSPAQARSIVAYLRVLRTPAQEVAPGDPGRGRQLFEGKGKCSGCHSVAGVGGRTGPDLADVGSARMVADLEQSLLEPSRKVAPADQIVRVVTRSGAVITGRRLNGDTHTLQILDSHERLLSLVRDDLQSVVVEAKSPMPSVKGRLEKREVADLISYLKSLRGAR